MKLLFVQAASFKRSQQFGPTNQHPQDRETSRHRHQRIW